MTILDSLLDAKDIYLEHVKVCKYDGEGGKCENDVPGNGCEAGWNLWEAHKGLGFTLAVPKTPDYAYERDSLAVIACDGNGQGVVLWTAGPYVAEEMSNAGSHRLDNIGLDDAPEGISVWEGRYTWIPGGYECPADGSTEPHGKFRPPTDEEWASIRKGECPWDDEDWWKQMPVEEEKKS